jgi:hypothetical protein
LNDQDAVGRMCEGRFAAAAFEACLPQPVEGLAKLTGDEGEELGGRSRRLTGPRERLDEVFQRAYVSLRDDSGQRRRPSHEQNEAGDRPPRGRRADDGPAAEEGPDEQLDLRPEHCSNSRTNTGAPAERSVNGA